MYGETLKNGRICCSLVVSGLVLVFKVMLLLIPEERETKYRSSGFDRNCWRFLYWKRTLLIIVSLVVMAIETFKVFLSFSDIYATYLWYWLFVNKLWNSILCLFLSKILQENVYMSPIAISMDCIENLITWGSSTFLDFITAYLINLAIQMFERIYFAHYLNLSVAYMDQISDKIKIYLIR